MTRDIGPREAALLDVLREALASGALKIHVRVEGEPDGIFDALWNQAVELDDQEQQDLAESQKLVNEFFETRPSSDG